MKFLGEKGFADILLKGTTQNVIDLTKVDAEKFMQYVKAVRKIGVNDPLIDPSEFQLLKIYRRTGVKTNVYTKDGKFVDSVNEVVILRKGKPDVPGKEGFGWEHIKSGQHDEDIQKAFKLSDDNGAVKDFIQTALEKGSKNSKDEFLIDYPDPNTGHTLRIVLSRNPESYGSIQTAYPI